MNREEELRKIIEKSKVELSKIAEAKKSKCIRKLSDISDAEKIITFDTLYNSMFSIIKEGKNNGFISESASDYVYEEVLEAFLSNGNPKEFWAFYGTIA